MYFQLESAKEIFLKADLHIASYLIFYSIFTKASTEVPGFSVNSSPADHDFSSEMVIHIKRMCTLQ